jgi:DNA-binding NarL/FixJ family response regulator
VAIRIIIADDHRLMLDALVRALSGADGFEVIETTHSGAHVLPLVERHAPDLVLMDVHMPGMGGLAALDLIRERHPDVKVVLISAGHDRAQIEAGLRRGAVGYLVKSINPADLPSAVRQAYEGTAFSVVGSGENVDQQVSRETGLTEREMTILKALARGLSNKQISQELWVTEQTVKFHVSNIYRKLGVTNRVGAVSYAHAQGLNTGPE